MSKKFLNLPIYLPFSLVFRPLGRSQFPSGIISFCLKNFLFHSETIVLLKMNSLSFLLEKVFISTSLLKPTFAEYYLLVAFLSL